MESNTVAAIIVYSGLVVLLLLLIIVARNDRHPRRPVPDLILPEGGAMQILSWIALWMLVGSILLAGFVDVIIWATKSQDPSVSELVHYYLNLYPWVGWIVAGLAYHLLVDRPAPPL